MSKYGVTTCLKRGHVLSLEEIEKGCCYKCQGIDTGVFPDAEQIKRKPRKPPDSVNPDSKTLETIKTIHEAQKASEQTLTNKHKGLSGGQIFVIIVFVLILITVLLHYLHIIH